MKFSAQALIKLAVSTVGFACLLMPTSSWAQATVDPNPLQDLNQEQNRDPFSRGNDEDAYGGIMQLMHRAQMGTIRSTNEFYTEQDRSLNDAAAQFRQRQLERIQNQNQAQPANTINPQVAK